MSFNEQELRQQLTATAAQVSTPRLTAEVLIREVRRRRARVIAAASGSFLIVAALAVAIPLGLSSASRTEVDRPAPPPPKVMFATAINGQLALQPKDGSPPKYHVSPGERLSIRIAVTVPRHTQLTALWLGISSGTWGSGQNGYPTGMNPILAHSSKPLSAGLHTFKLHWRIPENRPGGDLYLTTTWSSHRPPVSVARAIAVLALH
jgi:hypothetical protein